MATDQTSNVVSEDTTQQQNKPFMAQAQESVSGAWEATVSAVRERPVTAAAIAAGAVAAIGGAAYAATQRKGNGTAEK